MYNTSTKMGYNSKCNVQNCTQNCCNTYGDCPQAGYSSSSVSKCKYYYSSDTSNIAGTIAGPVIAGVILLIIMIVCGIKKKREKDAQESIQRQASTHNNNNLNITNQQISSQIGMAIQNQPFCQPFPPQQVYTQQPYLQPPMPPMMQPPIPPMMQPPIPPMMQPPIPPMMQPPIPPMMQPSPILQPQMMSGPVPVYGGAPAPVVYY